MPRDAAGTASRPSRQEERSAATRERLLQATFECLVELGYARTTTPEVLRRCGVSRGAMLHHYPTRDDLVAAAVEYVLQRQLAEFEAALDELPEGANKAAAAIEQLWRSMSGPSHYAWLELVLASRTDEALRDRMLQVNERFEEGVSRVYKASFPRLEAPEGEPMEELYRGAPRFAFAVLTGMAVTRIHTDEARIRGGVDSLKKLASLVDQIYRG